MARETPKLIEDRTITGRGIVKIPTNPAYRHFWLYINVVRLPQVNFTSSKFNPDKGEYAKLTWSLKDYVIREDVVNYENQVFTYSVDPTGYIATAATCMYAVIRDYLDYLAPFIPAPPLVTDPLNPIYFEPLKDIPDIIKIVCRDSTGIQCKLYGLKYDVACPEAKPTPKEPPSPPPEPSVPPFVGLENSPPYEYPDDGGDTKPYGEDPIADIDPCKDVRWWKIEYTNFPANNRLTAYVKGKEEDVFSFGFSPNNGCRDGLQQDLLMNGTLAYSGFGCTSRAVDTTITFMGDSDIPVGSTTVTNLQYADCI